MLSFGNHLKNYWALYLYSLVIILFIISYFALPDFQQFMQDFWEVLQTKDEEQITSWFGQFGIWGPIMIILLMVLQMFLIVFPSWLPMVVAVMGYGPWVGFAIGVLAVFVASTIGYHLGEKAATPLKKYLLKEKTFKRLSGFMQKHGFWAVVIFRISPFLSNDGISFVAGMIRMGYRKYIAATMVGVIPLAAAIAYFGKQVETLEHGLYWVGGVGLLIYLIYLLLQYRD